MRPLNATIDPQALIHNFKRVKDFAPNSKVMSVLKANAYGHGLIESARALNKSEGFSVLTLGEAIELREFGVYNPESPDKGLAEIIVAKQRNGPIGRVKLTFLGKYTRFENYASTGYDTGY